MSTILALFIIVLPVFLLVGSGWAAVRFRVFPDSGVDALIGFATNIAVPVLLFRSISTLDLARVLRAEHLFAFYLGATVSFVVAVVLARRVWRRRPGESVAVAFSALFSNTVLLGFPIMMRAYGPQAMEPVFAIVAFHAAYCYLVGILTMEIARRDGAPIGVALTRTARAMFRNALTIGILLGFAVNLSGLPVPAPVRDMMDMLAEAALPVALFGLGGALSRYAIRDEVGEALMVAALSLLVHPAITWFLTARVFALPEDFVRAAVVIAAMPPGVNGYIFAAMYGRAVGTAASTVLLATALSVVTVTFWLWVLGGAALG